MLFDTTFHIKDYLNFRLMFFIDKDIEERVKQIFFWWLWEVLL